MPGITEIIYNICKDWLSYVKLQREKVEQGVWGVLEGEDMMNEG